MEYMVQPADAKPQPTWAEARERAAEAARMEGKEEFLADTHDVTHDAKLEAWRSPLTYSPLTPLQITKIKKGDRIIGAASAVKARESETTNFGPIVMNPNNPDRSGHLLGTVNNINDKNIKLDFTHRIVYGEIFAITNTHRVLLPRDSKDTHKFALAGGLLTSAIDDPIQSFIMNMICPHGDCGGKIVGVKFGSVSSWTLFKCMKCHKPTPLY